MRYLVMDYAGGKYWPIRSYESKAEAEAHAKQLGYRAKVKVVKK